MWCQKWPTGLFSGNGVLQNTPSANMNVLVGGSSSSNPDVVIATNPAGYNIALDLVGQQAITITAPASNSRISSIVVYTDDLSLNSSTTATTGSPSSCGLIVVNGTTAASPVAPNDSTIRSAITSDGATGSQASYCVLTNLTITSATTTITNTMIDAGANKSRLQTAGIADGAVTSSKIDFTTLFLGRSTPSTNQTTSGTTKLTLTGSSLVISAAGNYRILFLVTIPLLSGTVIGDRFIISVEDGGTPIGGAYFVVKQNTLGDTLNLSVVTASNVSAGSHTYTLSITREIGTGTASTNAASAAASIVAMAAL